MRSSLVLLAASPAFAQEAKEVKEAPQKAAKNVQAQLGAKAEK